MDKFAKRSLIEVEWRDATSVQGWNSIADLAENFGSMKVRTVGYLIKQSKDEIMLGMTQTIDDSTNMAMVIPAKWVTKVKVLRKG